MDHIMPFMQTQILQRTPPQNLLRRLLQPCQHPPFPPRGRVLSHLKKLLLLQLCVFIHTTKGRLHPTRWQTLVPGLRQPTMSYIKREWTCACQLLLHPILQQRTQSLLLRQPLRQLCVFYTLPKEHFIQAGGKHLCQVSPPASPPCSLLNENVATAPSSPVENAIPSTREPENVTVPSDQPRVRRPPCWLSGYICHSAHTKHPMSTSPESLTSSCTRVTDAGGHFNSSCTDKVSVGRFVY